MGKRKRRQRAEPMLFDLPLHSSGEGTNTEEQGEESPASVVEEAPAPETRSGPSILFDEEPSVEDSVGEDDSQLDLIDLESGAEAPAVAETDLEDDGPRPSAAYPGDRLLGGLADLSVQVIMLGLAIAATHSLGIIVSFADWKPFGVLVLVFSFLYWVVPLAFWGQTPGMAWVGHTARASSGEPLSFGQTFLRWLGSVLTLVFAGLPLLLAFTGRSLTDRLSDSRTLAD